MAHVGWYLRRARAMSAGEVAGRGVRALRHAVDDVAYRHVRPLWVRSWEPRAPKICGETASETPLGFLHPDRAQEVAARFPEAAANAAGAADEVLDGVYTFFGETARLPRPLEFAIEPVSGGRWPARHGKRIDYRSGGDPKWTWELNRLHHLPLLSAAWLLSGHGRFAERAAADVQDWSADMPVGRGIAWTSGFEAGLRALSLALCHDALRAAPGLAPRVRDVSLRTLWQHARFIRRDPSTHSSANNHRIGELAGLAAIGLLAPELREAEAWLEEALRELAAESDRQILPDGTSAEQSYAYHLSVLELLLVVVALADARGRPRPGPIVAALERSADAVCAQVSAGEPEPRYGDSDDGRALRLGAERPGDTRRVAGWLAAALGHERAAALATPDPSAVWLFGGDAVRRAGGSGTESGAGDALLPDAGIVVFRRAGTRTTIDAGPLGHGKLAAHGHADALQVTVADDDGELVVDPGVGSYYRRPDLREAFRGTGFHATVLVDGRNQSRSGGPFLWSEHAAARFVAVDVDAGVAVAEHDGYRRLADPVGHRRGVLALEDGLTLVVDRLRGRSLLHGYSQRWPLAPELDASADGAEVRASRDGSPRLLLSLASSAGATLRLAHGELEPPLGWFSRGLERVEPAWICLWDTGPVAEVVLAALLHPVRGAAWPVPELELVAEADRTTVSFGVDADRRSFVVDLDETPGFRAAAAEVVGAGAR